jgi:nucleotide-binding universal stress UspA family protein
LQWILVPIDFEESTAEALRYAVAFAREYKATITLLHVVKPDNSETKRALSRAGGAAIRARIRNGRGG